LSETKQSIRLGTRGSLLAKTQSQMVADALEKLHPDVAVELIVIKTSGDRLSNRPLYDEGGKGLFTKEIEQALLDNKIDFAVHSFKDVPVTMPLVDQSNLVFAAVSEREDPRDVLVSNGAKTVEQLSTGAKVGTSSLRRKAQLLQLRPDLQIEPIRGNIDTRLRKIQEQQFEGTILALAGLKRSGLFDATSMTILELDQMLPAAAQGALAIQCRRDDSSTRSRLEPLNHHATARCVEIERSLVQLLEGDCHSPIAALATVTDGWFTLRAAVAGRDGTPPVSKALSIGSEPDVLVKEVHSKLVAQGVQERLRQDR
jgi:hydroxymethylbilane synthase